MQENFTIEQIDLSGESVLIGLSGGINSMAVLCYVATQPEEYKPAELHLFYSHLQEHSPGTFKFVKAGIRYARKKFAEVRVKVIRRSALRFFEEQKMIPHPGLSPCSRILKYEPMDRYVEENGIDIDLIGYVREEKKRMDKQRAKGVKGKYYPIAHMSDEDCFSIVKQEIGWYPAIYDIKENGKRMFGHNNCLPCKNMHLYQIERVKKYYPDYYEKAGRTADKIGAYWGRKEEITPVLNACDYCLFD